MNATLVRLACGLLAVGATMVCGCRSAGTSELAPLSSSFSDTSGSSTAKPGTSPVGENRRGEPDRDSGDIRTVQFIDDADETPPVALASPDMEGGGEEPPATVAAETVRESMPLDLPTALRLAGANHLQIALAGERVREAAARLDQADVLWVPSLNLGVGYNRHDGRLQEIGGGILDVSRQSLYAGGGPALGAGAPLSGGASGPARFFVDLSLADVFFLPLVARQDVLANQFESNATFNDSLLQVGFLYQELVRAQMEIDIAAEAVKNAEELARITENFSRAGTGLEADARRALAELQQRRRERAVAEERVEVVSAELVRLLRLDPRVRLVAVDPQPLPLNLLPEDIPIEDLIAQGLTRRPELAQHQSRVAETLELIRRERWRPWLPHLFVGYAGAGFGGGEGSDLQDFGARGDFDALAVWEWQNFGLGNRALRRERESQHRQAHLQYEWVRDQVAAEVSQAHYRSAYRRQQMEHARRQVTAAAGALPLNFKGMFDGVLRPIEAQQAIAALASARSFYLASVIDYNRAQLELLRAIGEPPSEGAAGAGFAAPLAPQEPAEFVPPAPAAGAP